jgi:hypothetical protein
MEEKKVQKAIKDAAKRNDMGSCKVIRAALLRWCPVEVLCFALQPCW